MTDVLESVGRYLTNEIRSFVGGAAIQKPQWDSIASPRATAATFVAGMEGILYEGATDYERVRRTLPSGYDWNSLETRALKSIFDRFGPIPNVDLPGVADVKKTGITNYEVFPYAVDHTWIWKYLDDAPRQKVILRRGSDDDSWRFSEQTLADAPALADALIDIPPEFPSASEKHVVRRVFGPMFDDSPWWSWVVFLGSFIAAYFIARTLRRFVVKLGNGLNNHRGPNIGAVVKSIATSLAILIGTVVVVAGSAHVAFSPVVDELLWTVVRTILLVAFIWMLFAATDLAAKLIRHRFIADQHEYGEMAVTTIQRAISTLLAIVLVIFILENVLSMRISALITGLGIVGLALSLAGKETAQNLFGAVSIFANRPFVVGDWISYKGEVGAVQDVKMQATHIRLLSGEMLIVPNMQFVSNEVENLAMRRYLRREMNIAITYDTPAEKVDEAIGLLEEILRSDDVVKSGRCNLDERPPLITFSDYGEYYLNLKVYYWYFIGDEGQTIERNHERGWFSYLEHCSLVNRAILNAFNTQGIDFAFPTKTIDLKQRPDQATGHEAVTES